MNERGEYSLQSRWHWQSMVQESKVAFGFVLYKCLTDLSIECKPALNITGSTGECIVYGKSFSSELYCSFSTDTSHVFLFPSITILLFQLF